VKTIFNGENNHNLLEIFRLLYFKNHKKSKETINSKILNYHSNEFKISFFTAGRCALYKILSSLNYNKTFKVAIQAFTCSVIPKAILDAGGLPIYVDIEIDSLSMDLKEIKKKIKEIDVVVLQYTFGITPKYLSNIAYLCKKNSKIFILDKAHCMPEKVSEEVKFLESHAYGIFYSTDHTKALNAVRGGICLTKKNLIPSHLISKKIDPRIPFLYESIFYKESLYIFARIFSSLMKIFAISYMPKDDSDTRILSNEIFVSSWYTLVLEQLNNSEIRNYEVTKFSDKLRKLIKKNKSCISLIKNSSATSLLRFPILFNSKKDKLKFLNSLSENQIKISDWFGGVLTCSKKDYKNYYYKFGDCPVAENIAYRVLGIPCNRRFRDKTFLKKLTKVLKTI
tara:strand:- start:45889 stop:47076 length:1188 start_codon:yes stop_codon:yes gene_type:complete